MSEAIAINDDAAMFSDPDFARAIQERTRARAKAFFHGRGFERLVEIAKGKDDKAALSAITTIGKLAGEFKPPKPVMLSFDDMIRAAQASAGPLSGLTRIAEAAIIDAEDDSSDSDTE